MIPVGSRIPENRVCLTDPPSKSPAVLTSMSISSGPMSGESTHGSTSTPLTFRLGLDGSCTRSSAEKSIVSARPEV